MRDTSEFDSPKIESPLDHSLEPESFENAENPDQQQHTEEINQKREAATDEEKVGRKILSVIEKTGLPPEARMTMYRRIQNGLNLEADGIPTERDIWEMVKAAAAPMAAAERHYLESLGFTFETDNTLILDEAGEQAHTYENVKQSLARLSSLTELYSAPIARGEIKRIPVNNTERLYSTLVKLGIDAGTVQNALSEELIDAIQHSDFVSGQVDLQNTPALLGAIDKTIRAFENKGKFTLDLHGDPQPIGGWNKAMNFLSRGRRAEKQKSSREYQNIISLQTLRDAIAVGPMPQRAELPAGVEQKITQTTSAPKRRVRRDYSGDWAAGIGGGVAGLATIGAVAATVGGHEAKARDIGEPVKVSAVAPKAESTQADTQDGLYQFPEITIAPQKAEVEATARPRRERTEYTPARSAEAETVSQARSIDEALDLRTTKKSVRTESSPRRTPKIDVFADHSIPPDAAKAPVFAEPESTTLEVKPIVTTKKTSKKESTKAKPVDSFARSIAAAKKEAALARENRAKAAKIADDLIPKNALASLIKKDFAPKSAASERALAHKAKAIEIANRVKAERAARQAEVAEPSGGLMSQIESSLNNKFGADAERYLKALPKDVRAALSESTPAQARALLADKIINIHEDPGITAERITALHAAKEALKGL